MLPTCSRTKPARIWIPVRLLFMILCIAMGHYKAFGTYNGAMMLSPSLVGTLRTFNQMDPAARSGMLPVRDGAAFAEKVLTMSPSQTGRAPGGTPGPPIT